jgi:hypothetical protein
MKMWCENSEIVARSVSLMMATTLEISFLKHDDKNYFIYTLLCYNEIVSFTAFIE